MTIKDLLKYNIEITTYDSFEPDLWIILKNKHGYNKIWYDIDFAVNAVTIYLDEILVKRRNL